MFDLGLPLVQHLSEAVADRRKCCPQEITRWQLMLGWPTVEVELVPSFGVFIAAHESRPIQTKICPEQKRDHFFDPTKHSLEVTKIGFCCRRIDEPISLMNIHFAHRSIRREEERGGTENQVLHTDIRRQCLILDLVIL